MWSGPGQYYEPLWHTDELEVIQVCFPGCNGAVYTKVCAPARNNLPWLTKEIVQLIRKRNHHFRKAKHCGHRDDYLKFSQVRNRVVAELRIGKRRLFANLHPHNQREFWKMVKSLTPKENSKPTLSSGNIVASTNPEETWLLNVTSKNCLNYSVPG